MPTVAAFSAASARRFFSIELRRRIRPVFIQALRTQTEVRTGGGGAGYILYNFVQIKRQILNIILRRKWRKRFLHLYNGLKNIKRGTLN